MVSRGAAPLNVCSGTRPYEPAEEEATIAIRVSGALVAAYLRLTGVILATAPPKVSFFAIWSLLPIHIFIQDRRAPSGAQ